MLKRTISADDLARLKREREAADRAYNDALTRLDGAVHTEPTFPDAPPDHDDTQPARIMELARELDADAPPVSGGWRARFERLVWQLVGPRFEQQQRLNRALADHIARNATAHRETARAIRGILTVMRDHVAETVAFQSILVQYAQEITPYLDTKDREVAGLLRRVNEDTAVLATEGLRTQERTLGLVQQRELMLKREFERLSDQLKHRADADGRPAVEHAPTLARVPASGLEDHTYVGFERAFRGSEDQIRARLAAYVPYFAEASDVLDVGSGRGEFLDVLAQHGIRARGVDTNGEMVEACRARGLDVAKADVVSHLGQLPDGSLGGLFAAQVVEHLKPEYLTRFLDLAYQKLRPGSKIVIETINVACWSAFFGPYLRDLSHERPIPSETLTFLLQASGFQHVELKSSSPVDEATKLQRIPVPEAGAEPAETGLTPLIAAFNDHVDRLNDLLFSHLDYAAIAEHV